LRPPPARRSKWLAVATIAFIPVLMATAAIAGLDWRLRQAPISANYLIGRVEAAINKQVAPLTVKIGQASLRYDKSDQNRFGVLLTGLAVAGPDGTEVANVAAASVNLDWIGLLTGSVVPTSLTLLQPQIQLNYAPGKGLLLRTQPDSTQLTPASPMVAPAQPNLGQQDTPGEQIAADPPRSATAPPDVIGLLRSVVNRGGPSLGQGLTTLQIRDAMITLGEADRVAIWQVPQFDFRLENHRGAAILTGTGSIVAPRGPLHANMTVEQPGAGGELRLTASLDRIVPADLAALSPAFLPLAPMLLPVGGEANLAFQADGALSRLDMNIGLGKGQLDFGGACADSFRLDKGGLHVSYLRGTGRVELLPSELASNGSEATISGLALVTHDAEGRDRWQYNLELSKVRLADPPHGLVPLPVDTWNARGTFTPSSGETVLDRMSVRAGDARLAMAGRIADTGLEIEAQVQDADPGLLLRLWPGCFQSYARNWVLNNVRSGKISKGHMRMALGAQALKRLRATGQVPDEAATAEFAVSDLAFTYADGLPAIIATRGNMQFAGRRFTAQMPDAASQMPSGRVLTLTNANYEVSDFLDPSPRGRITFEANGPIETALEFLNAKPLGLVSASGLRFTDLTGDFTGKLELELPVTRAPQPGDLNLKATASLRSLRLAHTIGGYALQGGTVDLQASEAALRADGDLLINGVAAKVFWSRPIGAGVDPPPPIRIAATLDANDREQLGIFVNHMIAGDVPVTVDLAAGPDDGSGQLAHVEANLGGAELVLDTLAWRKPEGDAATVAFDVVAREKTGARLENFRLTGDKVAIGGDIELGADSRFAAFHFPNFSINLISQLEVSGTVRPDKVLEVKAQGRFFDGRDYFRSLFSIGQITAKKLALPKTTSGLDLTADIETILGASQTSLHAVHIHAERRQGLLTALKAGGTLDGGQKVSVSLDHKEGQPRFLLADTGDSGRAFGLIGLYQGLEGGYAQLKVNLDGEGAAEKTGTLWAKHFVLLGDPVVNQVLNEAAPPGGGKRKKGNERESFDFDRLNVHFSIGDGQLVVHDMFIHGPVLGATLRGRIDYGRQTVQLGGTYIPLYGLNSMFGALPLFGPLLVGRSGEGLLGITFAIDGPLAKPDVLVNPVSVVAPGIFRQIFEIGPDTPGILARDGSITAAPGGEPLINGTPDIGESFPPMTADQATMVRPGKSPPR